MKKILIRAAWLCTLLALLISCRSRSTSSAVAASEGLDKILGFDELNAEQLSHYCFGKTTILFAAVAEQGGEYIFPADSGFSKEFQNDFREKAARRADEYHRVLIKTANDLLAAVSKIPKACHRADVLQFGKNKNLTPLSVHLAEIIDGPDTGDTTISTWFLQDTGNDALAGAKTPPEKWRLLNGRLQPATGKDELHVGANLNVLQAALNARARKAGDGLPPQDTIFLLKGHGAVYDKHRLLQRKSSAYATVFESSTRLGSSEYSADDSFPTVIFADQHAENNAVIPYFGYASHWTRAALCQQLGKWLQHFDRMFCGELPADNQAESQGPRGETQGPRGETQGAFASLSLEGEDERALVQGSEKAMLKGLPSTAMTDVHLPWMARTFFQRKAFDEHILQHRVANDPDGYRLASQGVFLDQLTLDLGSRSRSLVVLDTCFGSVSGKSMVAQNFPKIDRPARQVVLANPNPLLINAIDYGLLSAPQYRFLTTTVADTVVQASDDSAAATRTRARYQKVVAALNGPPLQEDNRSDVPGSRLQIGFTQCAPETKGAASKPICRRHSTRNIFLFADLLEYLQIFAEAGKALSANASAATMQSFGHAAALLLDAEIATNWWAQIPYDNPYELVEDPYTSGYVMQPRSSRYWAGFLLSPVRSLLSHLGSDSAYRWLADLRRREGHEKALRLQNSGGHNDQYDERNYEALKLAAAFGDAYVAGGRHCAFVNCNSKNFSKAFPDELLVKLRLFSGHFGLRISCENISDPALSFFSAWETITKDLMYVRMALGKARDSHLQNIDPETMPADFAGRFGDALHRTQELHRIADELYKQIPEATNELSLQEAQRLVALSTSYVNAMMTLIGTDTVGPLHDVATAQLAAAVAEGKAP